LLGYGFSGFWVSDESLYVINNSWAAGEDSRSRFHAHSGFIDLLLAFGWLGALLFMINFITVLIRIFALANSSQINETLWTLQFLTIMLLFNLSEVGTIVANHMIWTLYVSTALSTALQQDRVKRKRHLRVALNST
jgi:O-antigen ligase